MSNGKSTEQCTSSIRSSKLVLKGINTSPPPPQPPTLLLCVWVGGLYNKPCVSVSVTVSVSVSDHLPLFEVCHFLLLSWCFTSTEIIRLSAFRNLFFLFLFFCTVQKIQREQLVLLDFLWKHGEEADQFLRVNIFCAGLSVPVSTRCTKHTLK